MTSTVGRRCAAVLLAAGLAITGVALVPRAATTAASQPGATAHVVATVPLAKKKKKIWKPRRGVSWQWQLSGRIDTSVKAKVYDVDSSVSAKTVARLHAKGRKVICYISAGSWESYRPDAARFPASVKGLTLDGWPDERWLDIRRQSVLKPIMAARMNVCRAKKFDGVEADNVDGYQNATGFPLTAAQQRSYNVMLSKLAHKRRLAIGLKNDIDQVASLRTHFEFAINEQCVQYDECDAYRSFLASGKPVFHAEYSLSPSQFCPTSRRLGLSSVRKHLSLSAWRRSC